MYFPPPWAADKHFDIIWQFHFDWLFMSFTLFKLNYTCKYYMWTASNEEIVTQVAGRVDPWTTLP